MKKISLFLISMLIILFLVACEPVETGSISLISPNVWTIFYDENLTNIQISLSSSYKDPKMLKIDNNGTGFLTCLVEAGEQYKICPVPVSTPGDQKITIKVPLNNGEEIILQTSYKWLPYTPLDKQMQFGIIKSPMLGYLIVYLFTVIAIYFAVLLISKKNYELSSAIATFFSIAAIVNSRYLPSLDQAIKAGYYLCPIVLVFLSLTIKTRYYFRPSLIFLEDDGEKIKYVTRPPHGLAFRYLEVNSSEINDDLVIKKKEE